MQRKYRFHKQELGIKKNKPVWSCMIMKLLLFELLNETSHYYRHMAPIMSLKFMSESELGDLARETGQPLLPPHGHHHGPQVHVGV